MMKKILRGRARIFGHDVRTKYLVGVAMHGPVSGRELARRLAIDPARLPSLFRVFRGCGVVRRDENLRLQIDDSFPAYAELMVLLRALGGERVIVVPDDSPTDRPWPRSSRLFGTITRTRLLITLAALGSAKISDLAIAAFVPPGTVRHIVNTFESEGIIAVRRLRHERVVRIADDPRITSLLENLLSSMTESVSGLARRTTAVLMRIDEESRSIEQNRIDHPALPFGTDAQGRVLGALLEPMRATDVSAVTGLSKHTVRQVIDVLEIHDLVVTTVVGRGPRSARWVVLNKRHPLTPLIAACISKSKLLNPMRPCALPPKNLRDSRKVQRRTLPGEREMKTSVITTIQMMGEAEVSEIARALGRSDHARVRRCVERLRDANLVEYGLSEGRMRARLSRAAANAAELDALVTATREFLD